MQHITHAHEFPRHSGELSPAWLTRVLRARGALHRGRVVSVQLAPLGSGAAEGQPLRIVPSYDLDEAGAPRSLIIKLAPQRHRARLMRATLGQARRELRFYAELAPAVPALAPTCLHAELEVPTGCYALVLEEACGVEGLATLQCVELALSELARLHAAFAEHPTSLGWERDEAEPVAGARRRLGGALEQLQARMGDAVPRRVAEAVELYCAQLPVLRATERAGLRTLLHGDPSPRHWITRRAGATLVDWQAVTVGSPGRDVARLISSALPAVLRQSQEQRLLAGYHAALFRAGVTRYTFADCLSDYRRGLLEAAVRTVLGAARAQERVGQSAVEVEGSVADQLARIDVALAQNEVLARSRIACRTLAAEVPACPRRAA